MRGRIGSAPRVGRPRADAAGEVEARILDAAALIFLELGFSGASLDLIAETARCGKPTIYARYPDKERLFEAAFLRQLAARNARLEGFSAHGETPEARLESLGAALIEESLNEEFLGLMRLAVAESRRLPEMVSRLVRLSRERGGHSVARLLFSEGLGALRCAGVDDPRALRAGRLFAELTLLPFLMRALAREDLDALRHEIPEHVRERAAFFLAALRGGGV